MKKGKDGKNPFEREDESSIFKKMEVFNSEYIPKKIFERESFGKVKSFFSSCLNSKLRQQLLIFGENGVGKTLSVKHYGSLAEEYAKRKKKKFSLFYLNLREISSVYLFWQKLLETNGVKVKKGYAAGDLVDRFFLKKRGHIVLILDEFDSFLSNLGDKANEILHPLVKSEKKAALSLILTSNNAYIENLFDSSISSSLNSQKISIPRYTKNQMEEIIKQRAKIGLIKGALKDEAASLIADCASDDFFGDARAGIKLLLFSAKKADREGKEKIEVSDIKESIDDAKKEASFEVIERLPADQLFVLKSISLHKEMMEEKFMPTHEVYKDFYVPLCKRKKREPKQFSSFMTVVSSLASYDFITNLIERKDKGFLRMIELKAKSSYIDKVFSKRF